MKELYIAPDLEIIEFDVEDVITESISDTISLPSIRIGG